MKTWLTADQHFYHGNILKFLDSNGNRIRPFSSVEEMNEFMIDRWNSVVAPDDKVYVLGDIVMKASASGMEIIDKLHGRKVLIRGNHDSAKLSICARHFKDVRATHLLRTQSDHHIILSHVPLHPKSLGKWFNAHGHIHQNPEFGIQYLNLSVERTQYTPVSWDWLQMEVLRRVEVIKENSCEEV